MKKTHFFSALLSVCSLLGGNADAAVFQLKNVSFDITNAGSTGLATGTYTLSGEFKRDTTVGSTGDLTAWNITMNGPSSYSFTWVKNITGFTDNSLTFSSAGNQVRVLESASPGTFVDLTFAQSFNQLYVDPQPGAPGALSLQSTNVTNVEVQRLGQINAVEANFAGQADFIPLAPGILTLIPLASLFRRFRLMM